MYKHILVPIDGTAFSHKAARAAGRLAVPLKSRITLLHVSIPFDPRPSYEGTLHGAALVEHERQMRKDSERVLARAAKATGRPKVGKVRVVQSDPWRAIIAVAHSKRCDLVVMASHGRRGLEALILGSETQKVLTHSKTPVLVCR